MTNKNSFILYIILALALGACSTTKNLKPGEVLYTGAKIKINPESKRVSQQKDVKNALKDLTRPKPNKTILGFRYKLFFYNLAGEPKKEKGIRYLMRNKLGEPPVLMRQVNLSNNVLILQSYLVSKGYLQAKGEGETEIKGKKGKAVYTMRTNERYSIRNIEYPTVDTSYEITRILNRRSKRSMIKKGDFYDLDIFKEERIRIDNALKQRGYFYFNPNYILLQVDSTIGNNQVDVFLKIKDSTPSVALKPYYIQNINIYPNYTLEKDSIVRFGEPVQYKDFTIYDPYKSYKPKLFDRLIFFESGERYNRKDHALTLNRLVNIGTFKFVKADFIPTDSLVSNKLDVDFVMTSLKKNALTFQVTGTSKSNNFVGSEVKLTRLNRNLFKGAEQLQVGLSGGFERQVGGQAQKVNSYSLGADASLIFPGIVLPIFKIKTYNAYLPKTHFTLGAEMLNRANYYTLVSGKGEFGYIWKGNEYIEHTLNPISISYVRTLNTSDSFDRMLQRIPTLRSNFENQFITASNYSFTYNDQIRQRRKNNIMFIGSAESSGALVNLFLQEDETGTKRLFNTAVNQYLRFEADFRDYYKIRPERLIWANRIDVGVGLPYGNSRILPYVRQFFAGGTSDIRAFRARSLGPGTFNVNEDSVQLFADQGGDIKFMLNTELRTKIYGMFHAAAFIDAGNIWLAKEDTSRPGGKFQFSKALSQMAVGAGVGLRIDAKILVVRFDVATPLRKPYLPKGECWVFDQMNFGDSKWRRDNIILNIGIGYPF